MNKSIKLIFNYFLAPVLFVLLCWSLYSQLVNQADLGERWLMLKVTWKEPLFAIVVLLMIVNWGIEARKWQVLMKPLERMSLLRAFKSVLAGCSVTFITPNRVGEFGGRILFVHEGHRAKAIPLTILGSMSQLLITLVMGIGGLLLLRLYPFENDLSITTAHWLVEDILLWLSVGLAVMLAFAYMYIDLFIEKMERFNWLKPIVKYITILHSFSRKQLLRILVLSFFRYLVFILQYVWLLQVTGVDVDFWTSFWIISVFYLLMAMAPTIGFIELPVRAVASVELFAPYSQNILGIQAAALGIWIINLVIPAIIGSLLVFGIKILKDK
ncbi:MAG: hypothetical protein EOO01_01180 [Chitinophagaceae bacterium]|nr:MAG: hypothetical protein EOO01_01180 [Chitinophagaceae bacterium]